MHRRMGAGFSRIGVDAGVDVSGRGIKPGE